MDDPAGWDDAEETVDRAIDISGTWTFEYTVDETGCGGALESVTAVVSVVQRGTSIRLTTGAIALSGALAGRLLGAGGRYPDGGGETDERITATLNPRGTAMRGSSVWTYRGSPDCAGVSTFTATKN